MTGKIAVIGSGISGLAAAYYLSRRYDVWLFEKEARLGGHTHTHSIETSAGTWPIDTGFIVHNDRTYPNLVKLFAELGVESQASEMSFAVFETETGFEYSSRGVNGFLAQRRNAVRWGHYRLFAEMLRFNREAPALSDPGVTLGEFVRGYRREFVERYLVPMTAAIWSMSPEAMMAFPALTVLRFMQNHGMLGVNTHPQWKTLRGGCSTYVPKITAPFRERICRGVDVTGVRRDAKGVTVRGGRFDHVVFACHGDQVLPLLADATAAEREVLGGFQTSRNEAVLHTDERMLPRREAARASWNYRLTPDRSRVSLTYHMNRLQRIPAKENYCVTLNATAEIDPAKVLRTMVYRHPLYTREAIRSQARWSEISAQNRTHFCGAYWFYGFHEDGLNSALRVAGALAC